MLPILIPVPAVAGASIEITPGLVVDITTLPPLEGERVTPVPAKVAGPLSVKEILFPTVTGALKVTELAPPLESKVKVPFVKVVVAPLPLHVLPKQFGPLWPV